MTSAFSWQNSISLCPASFRILRPNLPVTQGVSFFFPQVFLDFLLLHSSPLKWKGYLFWVFVLECLVGLHWIIQLQLLQYYWLGHRPGLLWYWMSFLGNKQRSFCCLWDCIPVLHFRIFCWLWWLLHFFQGFLTHNSRYNGHWVKFTHSHPFSSLIPKMLMFTLAISCFTTSNLPWFMDLIIHVPAQYCSLQHLNLCWDIYN